MKSEEISLHEEVMMFLITNSNSVGGFEKLAPDASLNDGLLDVLVLRKCNLAEFVRVVSTVLRGEHLNDPNIIHFQTKHIEVSSPDYVQLNLDGELGGTLPCVVTILENHLQIIVDESGQSYYKKTLLDAITKPLQLKGTDDHE